MVELDLPEGRERVAEYDNDPAIIAFALVTALLISVHLFAVSAMLYFRKPTIVFTLLARS